MPESPLPNRPPEFRVTALHSRHLALGAVMASFSGWNMPLWYMAGAVKEHLAVIRDAGLFDTGHMDIILLSGEKVREFLNFACTRDISALPPRRAAYGAFLDQRGHCLDDAVIYPLNGGRYALVVNAGMGPAIRHHLALLPEAAGIDIREPAGRLAKLDLQGPASAAILGEILDQAEQVLPELSFFSFKGDFDLAAGGVRLKDGTPILLSRTGYTGELGFEIFLQPEQAGRVWDHLLQAGKPKGLLPCGLAARDSLRTGAVLPLCRQDIGNWPFINHPWESALPLTKDEPLSFTKDFVGRNALDRAAAPHTLPFAGFDQRRVDPHTAKVVQAGRECGTILTIVTDMAIGRTDGAITGLSSPERPENWTPRGLACGFVKVDRRLEAGTQVTLKDGRREIKAEIVRDIRPNRSARARHKISRTT